VRRSDPAATAAEVREFLVEAFGAQPRRSWGFDALYHRGRLFVIFDGAELVGKWPAAIRAELRAAVPGVHAFMDDTDSPDLEVRTSPAIIRGFSAAMEQSEAPKGT